MNNTLTEKKGEHLAGPLNDTSKMISSTISTLLAKSTTSVKSLNGNFTSITNTHTNETVNSLTTIKPLNTTSKLINTTTTTAAATMTTTMATLTSTINSTLHVNKTLATVTDAMVNTTINLNNSSIIKNMTFPIDNGNESFPVKMVILPLIFIFGLCIIAGVILFILRKNKLERLRHHLMPIYNFDAAEDGEDWETELLDDNFATQKLDFPNSGLKMGGLTGGLNLKNTFPTVDFNTGNVNINNNNNNNNNTSNRSSKSPTPSSGLLSSNNNSKSLYTSEKPIA